MPQEYGYHPNTDCHLHDDQGPCSYYLMVNDIWFEKDDGTTETDGYMNFSIGLFMSTSALEWCEQQVEDGQIQDGYGCFPNLGGWKFSLNFCLNGNYQGSGWSSGYSPLVIDRVTAAGDNTGFAAGFEYSYHNYSPNDNFPNPISVGSDDTQCLSATISAQAFGGASSGWSLGLEYPGMTLANVRVKYKGSGVDIIDPDLSNPSIQQNPPASHYAGVFGMGGHPYTSCYEDSQEAQDVACEDNIDLTPVGYSPAPLPLSGGGPHIGDLCTYRSVSDGMGSGYYCSGNAFYGEGNGSRGPGFRCDNFVNPTEGKSTYKYGSEGQEDDHFLSYCQNPNNDEVCGYCDTNFPLSCVWEDVDGGWFGDTLAFCTEGWYDAATPEGQIEAGLHNCLHGNYDCISDPWTLQYGSNHPGPSYPNWSGGSIPENIVFDIVRHDTCCSGAPSDSNDCKHECGSYMWTTEGEYLNPWTWLPSTWIVNDQSPPHCNSDYWTGCGGASDCCCNNPPEDDNCIAIPAWYDIFGCPYPQACNYVAGATEHDICDFPYDSHGYHNEYSNCGKQQGCPRLYHDLDGDGLIELDDPQHFCAQESKGVRGWACVGADNPEGASFPIFSSQTSCNPECGPVGGVCSRVWGFGQRQSEGEPDEFTWQMNTDLRTDIIHTCDPGADYSDFGYNHCEARGSWNGYGNDHTTFVCPNYVVEGSAYPGACFIDRYSGDPEPGCVWGTWQCDPNCQDSENDDCMHGLCIPWDEIAYPIDQCGVCNGNGSSCSAYGQCDQHYAPLQVNQDAAACLDWGNDEGSTWDPFDWEWGCSNSYCFSQMICPGGDKYTTDDICFAWGEKYNMHDYCQEGDNCWWDCEDTSGNPNHRCGCNYAGECNQEAVQGSDEAQNALPFR